MKITLITFLLSFNCFANVENTQTVIFENDKVYCVKYYPITLNVLGNTMANDSVSISCVSQASIKKDLLEIEILNLQKLKLTK